MFGSYEGRMQKGRQSSNLPDLPHKIRKISHIVAALCKEFLIIDDPITVYQAVSEIGKLPELVCQFGPDDPVRSRLYDTIHISAACHALCFREKVLTHIGNGLNGLDEKILDRERVLPVRKERLLADGQDIPHLGLRIEDIGYALRNPVTVLHRLPP